MSAETFQSFSRMIHPQSLSAKSSGAPDMIQMKKYEMIPGSLKRAISEKSLNRSIVVQVLGVKPGVIQISDGLHTFLHCVTSCDISPLINMINPVIRMTQWKLVQLMPKSTSLPGKKQFGIMLEKYEIVDEGQKLPVLGKPKSIKVNIFKDVKDQDESIITQALKNIYLENKNSLAEATQFWVKSIFRSLVQSEDGYTCGLCGDYLAAVLTPEVVSHVQSHLDFPGYRCPRSGCIKENLIEYRNHLELSTCTRTRIKTVVSSANMVSRVDEIVESYLKYLNVNNQTEFKFWVKSICHGIKSRNGYFCGLCGEFLSQLINVSVVSHVQGHLPEFPGYKCPRTGCVSINISITGLQKHIDEQKCTDRISKKTYPKQIYLHEGKGVKKGVPNSTKATQRPQMKSVKEMSTNILKSLNMHLVASSEINSEKLLEDDKDAKIESNKEILNIDENDPLCIPTIEANSDQHMSDISPTFNWQEELDRMVDMEEITTVFEERKEVESSNDLKKIDNREDMEQVDSGKIKSTKDDFRVTKRKRSLCTEEAIDREKSEELNFSQEPYTPVSKKKRVIACDPVNWEDSVRRMVPLIGKAFKCVHCGFKANVNHPKIAINHVEKFHMNMEGFKCTKCDLMCDSFMTFNEHMKIAHKVKLSLQKKDQEDEETSFSFINGCIEVLEDKESFDWQEKVKNIIAKGKFLICSDCLFESRDSLGGQKAMISHIETEHMKNLLGYRCPDCDHLFQAFVEFNQHMNISHNIHMNLLQNRSLFMKYTN